MTRMVRGKVIVDGHDVDEENIEAALSSEGESFDGEATEPMQVEEEEAEEENPLRDGPTFAPPTAPWVGAERAWRFGISASVNKDWQRYSPRDDQDDVTQTDFALSDDEVAAVLSSVPPPASATATGTPPIVRVFQYIGGVTFIAAAAVAVIVVAQSVSPTKNAPVVSTPAVSVEPDIAVSSAAASVPSHLPTTQNVSMQDAETTDVNSAQEPPRSMTFTVSELYAVPAPRMATESKTLESSREAAAKTNTAVPGEESALASAELEASEDQLAAFDLANPYTPPESDVLEPASAVEAPQTASSVDISKVANPLSRDAVISVMDSIAPDVIACANGEKGRIVMHFVVSGSTGRVKQAAAAYAPFVDTPIGRCAARAVKRAVFPRFNETEMTIKYPFEF